MYSLWIFGLLSVFNSVTANFVKNSVGIPVTHENKELIKDFVFPCGTPWIPDDRCIDAYSYIMLYDQEGKVLEYLPTDEKWLAERDTFKTSGNITFMLRFIWDRDAVKIMTSDMKLLTVTNENKLKTVPQDAPCVSENVHTDISQLACESRGDCSSSIRKINTIEGVMMSPECEHGRWKLVKKGIFLEIRNADNEQMKLEVNNGNLVLGQRGELFTGKETNFRTGYYLDNSNKQANIPYDGIDYTAYGDVVIQFQDRLGSPQESYVCNYLWDEKDSKTICSELNYTTGIPSYDGLYSTQKKEFAISGVECSPFVDSSFTNCPFKVRENENEMIAQKKMKAFGGKGYACGMTSQQRDIGGVICGSTQQIKKLVGNEQKCKRDIEDAGSPAEMFSLQKQIRKYSDKMSETKHWSEYLLPIPLSVTLLASVVLTSTATRPITLNKPDGGFEFLKYSSLEGNLVFVSNSIADSFFLSHTEMISVKLGAENIHRYLGKIIKYSYKSQPNTQRVKRYLSKLVKCATEQVEHMDNIIQSFSNTNDKLNELVEVLGDSLSLTDVQRLQIANYVKVYKHKHEKREKQLSKLKEEFKKMMENVKVAEAKFFEKSNELLSQRCIKQGAIPCSKCEHQNNTVEEVDGQKMCAVERIKVCDQWEDTDGECLESYKECSSWAGIPNFAICNNWDTKCSKWSKVNRCVSWDEKFCPNYKYRPAGSYCFASDTKGTDQCGKCNHVDLVREDIKKMTKFTSKFLTNILKEKPNNDELVSFLSTNLHRFEELKNSIKEYDTILMNTHNNLMDSDNMNKEEVDNIDKELSIPSKDIDQTKSNEIEYDTILKNTTNNLMDSDNMNKEEVDDIDKELSIPSKDLNQTKSNEIEYDHELIKRKNNIIALISTIKPLLETSEDLFVSSNTNEKDVLEFCNIVIAGLNEMKKDLRGEEKEGTKEYEMKVEDFIKKGRRLRENLLKVKGNDFPTLKGGMTTLGEEFASYQVSQVKRLKLMGEIESLSLIMEESIEKILAQEIEGDDLDAVLTYLRETSAQLSHISTLWTELKLFFSFIAETVQRTQIHSTEASEAILADYTGKSPNGIADLVLDEDTLEELKDSTIGAMAYNSYTYRIAKFYNGLMAGSGGGLLKKIKQVNADRHKFRESDKNDPTFKHYKQQLMNDAKSTQRKIKDDIGREEKIIQNRLAENIKNIENQFICALEDSDNDADVNAYIEHIAAMENVKKKNEKPEVNMKEKGLAEKTLRTPEPMLEVDVDFNLD